VKILITNFDFEDLKVCEILKDALPWSHSLQEKKISVFSKIELWIQISQYLYHEILWKLEGVLRATLHWEDKPICCVKGQVHVEAKPIWWSKFFILERHVLTWHEFTKLDAPKMKGQFLA